MVSVSLTTPYRLTYTQESNCVFVLWSYRECCQMQLLSQDNCGGMNPNLNSLSALRPIFPSRLSPMCEIEAFPHRQAGHETLMIFLLSAHRDHTEQVRKWGDNDRFLKDVQREGSWQHHHHTWMSTNKELWNTAVNGWDLRRQMVCTDLSPHSDHIKQPHN